MGKMGIVAMAREMANVAMGALKAVRRFAGASPMAALKSVRMTPELSSTAKQLLHAAV